MTLLPESDTQISRVSLEAAPPTLPTTAMPRGALKRGGGPLRVESTAPLAEKFAGPATHTSVPFTSRARTL